MKPLCSDKSTGRKFCGDVVQGRKRGHKTDAAKAAKAQKHAARQAGRAACLEA